MEGVSKKDAPVDKQLTTVLRAVVEARAQGCPVIGTNEVQFAEIAVRRVRSFSRRHPRRGRSEADRAEDLAKGLRDHFERNPSLAGPLIEDYRWLGSQIIAALAVESSGNA